MKIPLTKGKFAIIDPDDYELVSKYKWHAWYSGLLEDERERPDAVAMRADRKDWLVCMKLEKFLEIMKER